MDLFFWRKNRKIDQLAIGVADNIYTLLPPEKMSALMESPSKKNEQLFEREIQNAIARIEREKILLKLGVYGKARLHLSFMVRMEELGYTQKIARQISDTLILHTAKWR